MAKVVQSQVGVNVDGSDRTPPRPVEGRSAHRLTLRAAKDKAFAPGAAQEPRCASMSGTMAWGKVTVRRPGVALRLPDQEGPISQLPHLLDDVHLRPQEVELAPTEGP